MHKGKRKGLRAKAVQRKEQKIRRKGKTNERNTRKRQRTGMFSMWRSRWSDECPKGGKDRVSAVTGEENQQHGGWNQDWNQDSEWFCDD